MSRRLRVALTLTQDWHRVPGGTAVAANSLAGAVAQNEALEVLGVVPRGRPTEGFEPSVPTRALALGLPWLYDSWYHLRWPRVTSAVSGADIVHVTVPMAPPPERVPIVATLHDVLPLTMPESFTRRGVRLMARGLHRLRSEASMVMVPSEQGRREFIDRGFDPARVEVVPLGTEIPAPVASVHLQRVLDRHRIDPPYVLFVGTTEPRKGLDVLAAAMRRLDRSELTLVLAGPSGWGEVDLGGLERVVTLGHVPAGDLDALRAGAAVCAMPSRAEGFGLPVLEAMAAGVPVVTTAGTPAEEFASGVASFVPVGDPSALATALAEVLDDPDLAGELGAAGVKRAAEYTWDRAAERVVGVYREVLL